MRPTSASPTGTLATRPVRRTGWPSLICSQSPKSAAPTLSSSRLNARPVTPCSSSSISQRDAVLEPVDAGDAVADLEHGADLGEVGLDVELLDPLRRIEVISSGRSFTWSSAPLLVAKCVVVSSWRRRSRRPRTLASTRIEPACRTRPPMRSGSTERVASTLRPEACSIWRRIDCRSSGRELDGGRQLDVEPALLAAPQALELALRSRRSRRRGPSRRAGAGSCGRARSRPASTSPSAAAFARGSSCGLRSRRRSSGTSSSVCDEAARSSRTASSRPRSFAASKSAARRCGERRPLVRWLSLERGEVELGDGARRSACGGRRRRAAAGHLARRR